MSAGFERNDGGRKAAGFTGEHVGDCVARAVAIAGQLPYRQVYDELAGMHAAARRTKARLKSKGGRSTGRRTAAHGIWTKSKAFKDYMVRLGFRWVPTMQIGQGCTVHLCAEELPAGRLVVAVSRHYTAMIDGVINDTYDPRRDVSYQFEPDHGQALKPNQGRNHNGVYTEIGGRCVYGYWVKE